MITPSFPIHKKTGILCASILLFIILLAGTTCNGRSIMQGHASSAEQAETTLATVEQTPSPQTEAGQDNLTEMLEIEWICQNPELPTGCEITAATMLLNYYGFGASKLDLDAYLSQVKDGGFYWDGDVKYGPDPDCFFIGDTASSSGWICNPGPIVDALNAYIADTGELYAGAIDITGSSPEQLYGYIDTVKAPALVWVTIDLQDPIVCDTWISETDGRLVETGPFDHAMVLIGFSDENVILADPLEGMVSFSKERFENVYEARGSMSVIICP